MPKPILISGVQPTGKLHLGNYLGALKNFVELQNSDKYQCYFFIADLHSLTEDFNPQKKPKQILDLTADFLAAGLDPKKSTIFVQSQIPAHSELAWILNTITPFGELRRMTQFKEKLSLQGSPTGFGPSYLATDDADELANIGLFDYPVLMAADILLYDAQFVPVGEDQLQHLEFARTIVRKFNNKFGKIFIEPKALLTNIPRLMSLNDPAKKMSKSQPSGCIFLNDSPKIIQEKLARAVTDSDREIKYDLKNKPAVSNLLMIYSALSDKPIKTLEEEYAGKGYADFKKDLAKVISKSLEPFQKTKITSAKIKSVLKAGTEKAQKQAQIKIQEVKEKIGINF